MPLEMRRGNYAFNNNGGKHIRKEKKIKNQEKITENKYI